MVVIWYGDRVTEVPFTTASRVSGVLLTSRVVSGVAGAGAVGADAVVVSSVVPAAKCWWKSWQAAYQGVGWPPDEVAVEVQRPASVPPPTPFHSSRVAPPASRKRSIEYALTAAS